MHNVQFHKISILSQQKGLKFPGGVGGSVRPKNLKKCMKLNWNFQRGGEVWIFSGTTQCTGVESITYVHVGKRLPQKHEKIY